MKKLLARGYLAVLLVILYAPILIIAVFSFTEAKVLGNWTGFSTKLYESLFTGGLGNSMVRAIENTITIGLLAALCSTILGSIAAIGIHNMRGRRRKAITFLNDIPMLNPDIITGISLFILFVAIGVSQGYVTVLLAHISFCTPYVVLTVMPRLRMMNPNIYEAALDLGATPSQALRKVIIPPLDRRLRGDPVHQGQHGARDAVDLYLCGCAQGRAHSRNQAADDLDLPGGARSANNNQYTFCKKQQTKAIK